MHWGSSGVNTGICCEKHEPDANEPRNLHLWLQEGAPNYAKTSACATVSSVFHDLTTIESRICLSST